MAGQKINLTDEVVEKISAGFVLWLSKKANKPADQLIISVGHDSRISASRHPSGGDQSAGALPA